MFKRPRNALHGGYRNLAAWTDYLLGHTTSLPYHQSLYCSWTASGTPCVNSWSGKHFQSKSVTDREMATTKKAIEGRYSVLEFSICISSYELNTQNDNFALRTDLKIWKATAPQTLQVQSSEFCSVSSNHHAHWHVPIYLRLGQVPRQRVDLFLKPGESSIIIQVTQQTNEAWLGDADDLQNMVARPQHKRGHLPIWMIQARTGTYHRTSSQKCIRAYMTELVHCDSSTCVDKILPKFWSMRLYLTRILRARKTTAPCSMCQPEDGSSAQDQLQSKHIEMAC